MDDATSAVDPEVEQRILKALAAHTADDDGPTVLVVAYRKATIALADEVVFLDEGVIADRGSHAELVDAVRRLPQSRQCLRPGQGGGVMSRSTLTPTPTG